MHSAANQEKTDASHQKHKIAGDPIVIDGLNAQTNSVALASFPNNGDARSNHELNRIITKLDSLDLDELEPIEYLEMLLYLSSGRSDTRRLAERTMASYGSLAKIFARPGKELRELCELDHWMTAQLAIAKLAQKFILVPDLAYRERILSASDFLDYAVASMRESEEEVLRVIYLDQKYGIIRDQEMARGTVDTVSIYPREIAKRALAYCASSIILVHNHLSDDPSPSKSDIECTRKTKKALNALDIVLLDHLIISRSHYFSMSEENIF